MKINVFNVGFTPAVDNGALVDNDLSAVENVGSKKRAKPEASFGEIRTVTFSYKTQASKHQKTRKPPVATTSRCI